MKLLFFSENYDDFFGGAEICLKTFLDLFIKDGNFCRLVTKSQRGKEIINKSEKLVVIRIPREGLKDEILSQVSSFKPDFIGGQKWWGEEAIKEARSIHTPKMLFVKPVASMKQEIGKGGLRLFPIDLLVVNSKHDERELSSLLNGKIVVSYPLVKPENYKIKKNSMEYITMVNYREEKGKEIFRKIAQLLPKKKFMAVRAWMPKGSYTKSHENNITVVGPYKDMRKIYSKTKLLLVPSICNESFGRVVLEAMVNGIPVIASNDGGLKEAVEDGGIVINDCKNEKCWVEEIRKFDDREYYQTMSIMALKRAKRYNVFREYQVIVDAMEFVLKEQKKIYNRIILEFHFFFLRLFRYCYFLFVRKCPLISKSWTKKTIVASKYPTE